MKILIITYNTGKEIAEIIKKANASHHEIIVAAAEKQEITAPSPAIKIGTKADRLIHRTLGYISDSYHLHSMRATSTLLDRIAEERPDIIHIYTLDGDYLNLPMLAYVLMRYKIPTLLTLSNPADIYQTRKALIKRESYNRKLYNKILSDWELLHIAFENREMTCHELTDPHPGYIIDQADPASSYLEIYETI